MNKITTHKLKVLIVEDNEINAIFLETALNSLAVTCDAAGDGQRVLDMVVSEYYDLVFMDCQMPGMDGYTAAAQMRRLDKPYCNIPIIALTADSTKENIDKCIDAGMDDYIAKPIEPEELENILIQYTNISEKSPGHSVNSYQIIHKKSAAIFSEAVEKLVKDMNFTYNDSRELIREFIDVTAQIIKKMETSYEKKEYIKLAELAHQIKGMSCNLRLREFQKATTEIEAKSKIGQADLITDIQSISAMLIKLSE